MRFHRFIQLALLPWSAWAISRSDAGVVDWQKTLVGVPNVQLSATPPTFHRVATGGGKTLAFLLTMTNSNIFAVLDPVDGTVAWRNIFRNDDPILNFKANLDGSFSDFFKGVATLSGPGGANVRLFEVASGALVWERKLHEAVDGRLLEPASLGVALAFATDQTPDLFVLANAGSVYRLTGLSGEQRWKWDAPESDSMTLHSRIIATERAVYVVGLVKSFASYTLSVTALDAATGTEISTTLIPSSIDDIERDLLTLTKRNMPHPQLVWRQGTSLRSMALASSSDVQQSQKPLITPGYSKLLDVHLGSSGYFVALRSNGSASVFRQGDESVGVDMVWDFMDLAAAASNTKPVYEGGIGKDGQPYIVKMQWAHVFRACTMHLYAPHGSQGRGAVTGSSYNFDPLQHGVLLHAAIDVANPEEMKFIPRFALTTSTGAFQLWQQQKLLWTREESLASIQSATFADFPLNEAAKVIAPEREAKPAETTEASKSFLSTALEFVKMPYHALVKTDTANAAWRNKLGFRKMVIAATSYGKILALDSTTGEVLWGRILSMSDPSGMPVDAKMKLFLRKSAGKESKLRIGAVVSTGSATDEAKTLIYNLDALTGVPVGEKKVKAGVALPAYEFEGAFREAFAVGSTETALVVVDGSRNIHIYPPSARPSFLAIAPSINFHAITAAGQRLSGFKISSNPTIAANGKTIFESYPTWSTALGGQEVHTIVKNIDSPLASFGKVLGDRSTLYKYINQHLLAVTTFASSDSGTCGVYLVDAIKGAVIYSAHVSGGGVKSRDCGLRATLVDNWLVYYHHEDAVKDAGDAKGHRLVTVELYEGDGPDEDLGSFDLSSLSNETTRASVFQRSFVIPYGIKALTSSQTKYGISMKDIIVSTNSNQVVSIPRRLLDPRRPTGKATPEQQEEGLIPFEVVLHDDGRRILSHQNEVANTKQILTAPVQLESTSLVFAYGLDLFQTRVSPSNKFDQLDEDFNRIQLVLTILGLAVGIAVTKPIVRSKALSLDNTPVALETQIASRNIQPSFLNYSLSATVSNPQTRWMSFPQPSHTRTGSSSSDALRNWEKNRQYASTSTALPFPPTASSTLVTENIQLRGQLDLRTSIATHYEIERDACHQVIELLSGEMKRAVNAAEKWREEVGAKENRMKGVLKEQEKLKMLCGDLEEALERTREELEMRASVADSRFTGLPTPTEDDDQDEDRFMSFDDGRRRGQHHYLDHTMRTEATNISISQSQAPSPNRSTNSRTDLHLSKSSQDRSGHSWREGPQSRPLIPTYKGGRTSNEPSLVESSFETALQAGEDSIRRHEEEYEALQVRVMALQQEKEELKKEREQLLDEKNQVPFTNTLHAWTSSRLTSSYFQMEIDSRHEREYQEQLFEHSAQLETRLDETSTQLHTALENLDIARARLRTLERENAELEEEKASLEDTTRSLGERYDELARLNKEMEAERSWAARDFATTEARVVALDAERIEERVVFEAKRGELQAALEFERERREEREGELDALRAELDHVRRRKNEEGAEELAALKAQLIEARQMQKRRTNEDDDLLSALRKEVGMVRTRTMGLEQANATLELQVSGLKKQIETNKQDKEGLNIALDAKQQELDLLKRKIGAARTSTSSRALASARSRAGSATASLDENASTATGTTATNTTGMSVLLPKTAIREKGHRRVLQRSSSMASIVSSDINITNGHEAESTPMPIRRPLSENNNTDDDRRLTGIRGIASSVQEGKRPARALMEDTFVPPPSRSISFPAVPSYDFIEDTSATPRRAAGYNGPIASCLPQSQVNLGRSGSVRSLDRRTGKRLSSHLGDEETEKENQPRIAVAVQ
ncbi:hypothetical protein FRB96_008816 [Tulasnella sp. 330]|nr:hypothetical protein FRB96_008816 [Tulasnella sp. 330]